MIYAAPSAWEEEQARIRQKNEEFAQKHLDAWSQGDMVVGNANYNTTCTIL